jgi:hypothetical protein
LDPDPVATGFPETNSFMGYGTAIPEKPSAAACRLTAPAGHGIVKDVGLDADDLMIGYRAGNPSCRHE